MKNSDLVLAVDKNGNEIVLSTVNEWITSKQQEKLSQFLYDRLYGRYIKLFDYPSERFRKEYKNGFAVMANCCLLIETYVSFKVSEFRDSTHKSERCFGYFFVTEPMFDDFSEGGLSAAEYLVPSKNGNKNNGISEEFFKHVRCGILHSGETRNNWRITRVKGRPLFSKSEREINATKFMNRLKVLLWNYKKSLDEADIDNDLVWKNCINRLEDILNKA